MVDATTLPSRLTAAIERIPGVVGVYPSEGATDTAARKIRSGLGARSVPPAHVSVRLEDNNLAIHANVAVSAQIPTPLTTTLVVAAIRELLRGAVGTTVHTTITLTVNRIA
ncbi:hypothetical protein [Glaciibacter psychrotolerans]|uniref:Asp23/Gls24 family envelope stress response protein n=1 Tax=Glaciibacter psychrotolerans TaxID=670054 RepID=A0A7Z0EEK4_9MICO|nr:hypothetical protein [Leifsonia psychrotolerans]NYJ19502.1 hypothetical protein [Leifsonia psychrotolerans]